MSLDQFAYLERQPGAPADPECDRCGNPKSRHNGIQQFCPFYSTFRARLATPAPAAGTTPAEQAAYEQAAKWCEDRAAGMRERAKKKLGEFRSSLEHSADWVEGCADTIRHNAAALSRNDGAEEKR